jgi:hypothetical protein
MKDLALHYFEWLFLAVQLIRSSLCVLCELCVFVVDIVLSISS